MIRGKKLQRQSFGSSGINRYSRAGKEYSNPFFENKSRKNTNRNSLPALKLKHKIIIFGSIFVLFLLIWIFLYSNYFVIKNIEARGGGRIDPVKIQEIAWQQIWDSDFILWQQKNIFIFKEQELIDNLNLKYSFNEIIINKKLPSKIIIDFNEKEHSLLWLEQGIYYYTDTKGYIVNRIGDIPENKDYPLIENNSDLTIISNRVGIRQEVIDYAMLLIEKNKEKGELNIEKFKIIDDSNTLYIKITDGPDLLFDVTRDADSQLNKIYTLKNDILVDDFFKKQYIDVRIGDRVYHK